MKKKVKVVGAAIRNERDEFLCALRSEKMSLPNLWEFPGGKLEEGESPEEALIREIREELDCEIAVGNLIAEVEYEYPLATVQLYTYEAVITSGTPKAKEHAALAWVKRSQLHELDWAPADLPTVNKLSR